MKLCNVPGCKGIHVAKGFCGTHYQRLRTTGNINSAKSIRRRQLHGMTGTRIHHIWRGMIARCTNPRHRAYAYYGGRGIGICEKWRDSFLAFYHDMGDPPTEKHEIDRINPNGNYEPGNCRWVTRTENARCTRKAKLNMDQARAIRESTLPQRALAAIYGVAPSTITYIKGNKTWKEYLEVVDLPDKVVESLR